MSKLKLTITQWAIASLLAIVGVLAIILGVQNKKLKKAKLALLEKDLEIAIEKDDKNIKDKKKKLKEAKKK